MDCNRIAWKAKRAGTLSVSTYGECQMKEFGFSEAFIREVRRTVLVLVLCIIPFGLVFTLFCPGFRIEKALAPVGITCFWCGIIMAIETYLINRRQRRLKIFVYEDKLVKQSGKKQQTLLWEDIERIKIVERKNGDVAKISLYPRKPKRAIYICGFVEMKDLAGLIKENAPDRVSLRQKRWRLDWQNPFVAVPVSGVPTIVVMCITVSMGPRAVEIFVILCVLSLGLGLLIFRPLTRFDVSNKWFELLIVAVLLVLGIYSSIYFLLFGTMP